MKKFLSKQICSACGTEPERESVRSNCRVCGALDYGERFECQSCFAQRISQQCNCSPASEARPKTESAATGPDVLERIRSMREEELARHRPRRRADVEIDLVPHAGVPVLVYGILSLLGLLPCVLLGVGFGLAAWVSGSNQIRGMDEGRIDPSGRGMASAGRIMGIVSVSLVGAVFVIVLTAAIVSSRK